MQRVHFRINDELMEKIDRIATTKKLDRSKILRELIELGIDTYHVKERFNITSLYGKESKTQVERWGIMASIESLYLLRSIAKTIDPNMVEDAAEKSKEVADENW